MILIFVINAMMSKTVFELFAFFEWIYVCFFYTTEAEMDKSKKKNNKVLINDLIHLHSDLIFDHFDVNA